MKHLIIIKSFMASSFLNTKDMMVASTRILAKYNIKAFYTVFILLWYILQLFAQKPEITICLVCQPSSYDGCQLIYFSYFHNFWHCFKNNNSDSFLKIWQKLANGYASQSIILIDTTQFFIKVLAKMCTAAVRAYISVFFLQNSCFGCFGSRALGWSIFLERYGRIKVG